MLAVSLNGNESLSGRGRGLAEAQVEVAGALAAGDVHQDAVEHPALGFVLVEAEIEKLAQVAPALRGAEGIGVRDVAGAGVAVLHRGVAQERHDVARREEAEPDDRGAGRRVDDLINLARLETRGEGDVGGVGDDTSRFQPGERPVLPRDRAGRGVVAVAHQQHRIRVAEVAARVGAVAAVGKQLDRARHAGLEAHQQPAGDRTSIALRLRDLDAHQPFRRRHVVLPAAPHDRVAAPHQEAVAGIGRGAGSDRPRHAVERRQRQSVAAVRHVEEQPVTAAPRILRHQDAEIGRVVDEAVAAVTGEVDIGDDAVQLVRRIDGEMRRPVELDVTPDLAERPSIGELPADVDLETDNGHRAPPSHRTARR